MTLTPAGHHSNAPLIPEGWHKVLTCTFKTKQINFHGSSWILLNVATLGVGLPGFEFYLPLSLKKQVTYLDFFFFSHLKNATIVVLTSQGYCVGQDDVCELIGNLNGSAEGQCLDLDLVHFIMICGPIKTSLG